jgi:hypothetical protein
MLVPLELRLTVLREGATVRVVCVCVLGAGMLAPPQSAAAGAA